MEFDGADEEMVAMALEVAARWELTPWRAHSLLLAVADVVEGKLLEQQPEDSW